MLFFPGRNMVARRAFKAGHAIILMILISLIHPDVCAQAAFRARLFTGVAGEAPPEATINIESYSSSDELLELHRHLYLNDIDGFRAVFRQMKKGTLSYPRSAGLYIQFHAALERATDKGVQIFLVTDAQSAIPGTRKLRSWEFRFLVVVLDLDKSFNGEGKIYEDAELNFAEQDIEMVSSSSIPKMLTGVRLLK